MVEQVLQDASAACSSMWKRVGRIRTFFAFALAFCSGGADGERPQFRQLLDQRPKLDELGLNLPPDFFTKTFEKRSARLPGLKDARRLFQSVWGRTQVLRHASKVGFKAYEFGIPRPWVEPESTGKEGADAARQALHNNLTLVQNHVHREYAPLASFMQKMSVFFSLPGGMNSYTTPPGAQGFAYHFDPSDAFILQVEGRKTWELCNRRFPDPLGFSNPTYNQVDPKHADVKGCTKHVLNEGDAIYLPVGLIHRAVASEGYSIHLTMSLNRQFVSVSTMLLNVAEQINPSKTSGFAQPEFTSWLHRIAADPLGRFASFHNVPRALLCLTNGGGKKQRDKGNDKRRCKSQGGFFNPFFLGVTGKEEPLSLALQSSHHELSSEVIDAYLEELIETVKKLRSHSAAKEQLTLGMRIEGRVEPVVGKLPAAQVLEGLLPLMKADPCNRSIIAWRDFFTRQAAEYDETILHASHRDDWDEDSEFSASFDLLEDDAQHVEEIDQGFDDHDLDDPFQVEANSDGLAEISFVDIDLDVGETLQDATSRGALDDISFVDLDDNDATEKESTSPYHVEGRSPSDHDLDSGMTAESPQDGADRFAWNYPDDSDAHRAEGSCIVSSEKLRQARTCCEELQRELARERKLREQAEEELSRLTRSRESRTKAGKHGTRVSKLTENHENVDPYAYTTLYESSSRGSESKQKAKRHSDKSASRSNANAQPQHHVSPSDLGTSSDALPAIGQECCSAVSAAAQVKCANGTSKPSSSEAIDDRRVLIVTYATPHVHTYARYALPINANWAKQFNHGFVIDRRDRATGGVDVKNSKVLVKHHWVSRDGIAEKWILWIGADAIFTNFDRVSGDILRTLISEHAEDPQVQILVTRDPSGRAGNSLSLFNADVILLRRTEWTAQFLMRWWDDPRMKEGRTDQEVLELLYKEDVLGALKAFVLLPPLTLNSESLSIVERSPQGQPVIHLGGHADTIRSSFFKEVLKMVCGGHGPDPLGTDLQNLYIANLWQEVLSPSSGISSGHMHGSALLGTFQRLAHHLDGNGRTSEAVGVQRAALQLAENRLGQKDRDTLQAATALAGTLRNAGLTEEALALHRLALEGFVETLGWDNRDTLTSANNLALALQKEQPREAEQLFRKARRGLEKHLGQNALATMAATFNLASTLASAVGRPKALQEAEMLHRLTLSGRQSVLGSKNALTIESMNAMAQFLLAQGRAAEAEPLQREALEHSTGPKDTAVISSISTLAQSLKLQRRTDESVFYFELALDHCNNEPGLGGASGPNALAAASNLASALQDVGRLDEAGVLYKLAAVGLQRALGKEHPNTRGAMQNYEAFLRESRNKM